MYIRFLREDFDEATGVLTIRTQELQRNFLEEFASDMGESAEDVGDTDTPDGIVNYVLAKHAHHRMRTIQVLAGSAVLLSIPLMATGGVIQKAHAATLSASMLSVKHEVYLRSQPRLWGYDRLEQLSAGTTLRVISLVNPTWFHVVTPDGQQGYVVSHPYYVEPVYETATAVAAAPVATVSSGVVAPSSVTAVDNLPPGVSYDYYMSPLVSLNATRDQKFEAVLRVAKSKLGTPYIWGHNEDRGQYGFDCSNFTEYVYHHALGYLISSSSRVQAADVGTPVPVDSMLPGDLLIFDNGGHVGIYIGNGQMIEQGGGLGKVGYLRVSPGSYWYNHLTAVKRMF